MGKNIVLDGTDTSHIKWGNLEKPVLPPVVTTLAPANIPVRIPEDILQIEKETEAKRKLLKGRYGRPLGKYGSGKCKYDYEAL